jgi:hypothetical protein
MAKDKQIFKEPETESVSLASNFAGEFVGMEDDFGMEGMNRTLSNIPVLKLTQAMTPEAQSRDFPNVYPGMFINDATKEPLGDELIVRIIRSWKCRTKFAPREAGGAIECSCPTYNDPNGDFGSEYGRCSACMHNNFDMQDHCQVQHHLVVAMENNPDDLYRVILSKTSFAAGRALEKGMAALSGKYKNIPVFAFRVKISVKEQVNAKRGAKYFVYKLEALKPEEGKDLVPAELLEGFKDVYMDIAELRKDAIAYHKNSLAAKETQANLEASNSVDSEFASMGASLERTLAVGSEAGGLEEEVPF